MARVFPFIAVVVIFLSASLSAEGAGLPGVLSPESAQCAACHATTSVNIYQQWGRSAHFRASVGCFECHGAKDTDPDAMKHYGRYVSVIVSPLDCSRCHEKETAEFNDSLHSKAGRIVGSIDNTLAEVVEGNRGFKTEGFPGGISAAAVNGCWQCHGSVVKVGKDGRLDPATWPNTGMGRINPDGSEGSCSACHQRHAFSPAQARAPENCGKCHMGPDHPHMEIYRESKHGINYYANRERMNLGSAKWVVGEDYFDAPTCATCHMSAARGLPVTHNVGLRMKWNNRPALVLEAQEADKKWGHASASVTGRERRELMTKVCLSCHGKNFVDSFYMQYEAQLELYNEKWAKPGLKLYNKASEVLQAVKGEEYARFSQKIDYTWFELWHHEGRRVRHAAAMQAPDYVQWHGNYELARNFYAHYVPELKEVIEMGKSSTPEAKRLAGELEALLSEVLESPDHNWSVGKEDPGAKEERERRREEFMERYK